MSPGYAAERLLWTLWQSICRPGQVQTVFDVATFGRFTPFGGPEWAGTRMLRPLRRVGKLRHKRSYLNPGPQV